MRPTTPAASHHLDPPVGDHRIGGGRQGLLYGVRPDAGHHPTTRRNCSSGPLAYADGAERSPLPSHSSTRIRLGRGQDTGSPEFRGSDAKMVFMDFGDDYGDSALNGYFTFPTGFGHEVVADVVEVGPAVSTLEVGQRVVLNPWLSRGPRGIDPPCGSCLEGDYSLCWNFTRGPIAAGIHTGTSKDAPGGSAEYPPAHETHAHSGTRLESATRKRFWPTPSRCRCIRSRGIPRPRAARSSSTAEVPSALPSPR